MSLTAPGGEIISGLLRGEPNLPAFSQIDPAAEQKKAIKGNQAALPGAEKLASGVNAFNMQQLESMLQSAIPGYESIKSGVSSNIQDELAGKIPKDVQDALGTSDAVRALTGGYAGTGMHGNLVARDLGLTSLNQIDKGISSSESWLKTMASIEQPGFFNVSSMFLTPGQTIATDVEERNAKFQHDWTQNQLDWQGSLGNLFANQLDSDSSQVGSIVSSVAGSAAGGAAGGGGGGM